MTDSSEKVIVTPVYDEHGRLYYPLVNAASEKNLKAICYKVPNRVIPVIFLPGVMGSNLQDQYGTSVWRLNSKVGALMDWLFKGAEDRKKLLDPENTFVDSRGRVDDNDKEGPKFPSREERGWGQVAYMSYGKFLPWLQAALDDQDDLLKNRLENNGEKTLRQQLEFMDLQAETGEARLTPDEIKLSYQYQFPVHVMGYNWLQSNAESANQLVGYIHQVVTGYKRRGQPCEKVILVTHSMGGLVARHYSEILGRCTKILGIVHGVMPTFGAPTAYKRMKTGEASLAGLVIGKDGAQFTAVMAQSPGPLQLLPGLGYGKWWLKIDDGNTRHSLPERDPYEEIYLQRDKWWGLCEERFINPENKTKNRAVMQADWKKYTYLLSYVVRPFIEGLSGCYHSNTYAFYGNSTKHRSYGTVRWVARKDYFNRPSNPERAFNSPIFDPADAEFSDTRSVRYPMKPGNDYSMIQTFAIADPQEPGDGTVPVQGGKFTTIGLRSILGAEVEHENAYDTDKTRFFTLRAIVKIAQSIKQTSLAYPDE
ncbi:esterase/lipase family protein [Photorhabdus asymbiotica]|uniref:esterase/lipase family protein n=1 Tax=Photorhabdus asymbiotica TaxID=291112 RepID=UPI003DA74174